MKITYACWTCAATGFIYKPKKRQITNTMTELVKDERRSQYVRCWRCAGTGDSETMKNID